jgi:lysophospholipase L1-like esterase
MDPCMLAAELLAACSSEAPTAIKVGMYPAAATAQTNKSFDTAPSATAAIPETMPSGIEADADCPAWASIPARGCSIQPANRSPGRPDAAANTPAFSRRLQPRTMGSRQVNGGPRPASGDQLFAFRLAALRAGEMYTRASPQRYQNQWQRAVSGITYGQWKALLAQEAAVMAQAQGNNRLTILVGDSLSLWLPMEQLPRSRFWLNQSISGETTGQILTRLDYFRATRPDQIHVMAGINDLKNGASDAELVRNTQQILARLRQQHPQAQIMIYSILPTRLDNLPSDRIRQMNEYIAYVARQQGANFVDLQTTFADPQGLLRTDLTTDGLHLSRQGYEVWQTALVGN